MRVVRDSAAFLNLLGNDLIPDQSATAPRTVSVAGNAVTTVTVVTTTPPIRVPNVAIAAVSCVANWPPKFGSHFLHARLAVSNLILGLHGPVVSLTILMLRRELDLVRKVSTTHSILVKHLTNNYPVFRIT